MNRDDYIEILRDRLKGLPENEIQEAVRFVEEYFEEAGEDNFHQAMDELGSPYRFANQIKADVVSKTDYSNTKHTEKSTYKENRNSLWIIIIGILSLPLSFPLVLTMIALIFAAFVTIFAFIIAGGSFLFAGVVTLIYGLTRFAIAPMLGFNVLAIAFIILGIGLMLLSFFIWAANRLLPAVVKGLSNLFQKIKEKVS